ncbi:MAG: PLP-dependent aminotransferase family protein [Paracoccaceae bacterium]
MDTIWQPNLLQKGTAKYRALLDVIRAALENGTICNGDRMPPVRDMAWQLKITPGTVARAYKLGIEEGLLEAQVGRGTYIRDPKPTRGTVFGETHVEPHIVDLRNAAVPDFGQDGIFEELTAQITFGGSHSMVRYAGHNEMETRSALLKWMGLDLHRARPEDLILTHGSQNATLAAFLAILQGSAPVIATDSLVLPGTRKAAMLARAKIIGVPSDDEGMFPKALEELFRRDRPQILHVSANINNPTTRMMSNTRKGEIAEIARRFDIQIVEDDGQGKFFTERPPSFMDFCPERVWHVSSLSRYLAAGLRSGFLLCPPDKAAVGRNVVQAMTHSFSPIISQLTCLLIQSGHADALLGHIRDYRRERVRLAVNQLGRWNIHWNEAADFIWLELTEGWYGSTFSLASEKLGIQVAAADIFLPDEASAPNAVRLTLGGKHSSAIFVDALERLDHLLDNPESEMLA